MVFGTLEPFSSFLPFSHLLRFVRSVHFQYINSNCSELKRYNRYLFLSSENRPLHAILIMTTFYFLQITDMVRSPFWWQRTFLLLLYQFLDLDLWLIPLSFYFLQYLNLNTIIYGLICEFSIQARLWSHCRTVSRTGPHDLKSYLDDQN